MRQIYMINALLLLLCIWGCRDAQPLAPAQPDEPEEQVDILALGDSYTKGQSVVWEQNYPNQLKDSLRKAGIDVSGLRNIAQTGWRSDQLQSAIDAAANQDIKDSSFSLVLLCIGVNDQYQGKNIDGYATNFEKLLQYAITRAGQKKERVMVLSIPDWAYTPYAQNFSSNPSNISVEIDAFNKTNKQITDNYNITYVNVTPVSRQGLARPELVATDGLHPSAIQYSLWVHQILPFALDALKK